MYIVYAFDRALEDFKIFGGFTKRDEAEALKAETEAAGYKPAAVIEQTFEQALDQHMKVRLGPIADAIAGLRIVADDKEPGPNVWVLHTENQDGSDFIGNHLIGVFKSEAAAREAQRLRMRADQFSMCQPLMMGATYPAKGDLGDLIDAFGVSPAPANDCEAGAGVYTFGPECAGMDAIVGVPQ